ncbi:hypothetical protein [Alkalihalobacillus trypoxylicola]|uniref:hypothetical protein n=1 Tax=Alkalihalobacillus trypoxylicola TaxID=519424 RepID=UPI000B165045|nr:hypothetical protein [Alkalihalobacillus trypoxylicola]
MANEECTVTPERLKGKTVSDFTATKEAVVIKFEDHTYLDVYLDKTTQELKISTNKL